MSLNFSRSDAIPAGAADASRTNIRSWLHQNELSMYAVEKPKKVVEKDIDNDDTDGEEKKDDDKKESSYVDSISDKTMKAWMKNQELENKFEDKLRLLSKNEVIEVPKVDKMLVIDTTPSPSHGSKTTSPSHVSKTTSPSHGSKDVSKLQLKAMEQMLRIQGMKIDNLEKSLEQQRKENVDTIHTCAFQMQEFKDMIEKQLFQYAITITDCNEAKKLYQNEMDTLNETVLELKQFKQHQEKVVKDQNVAYEEIKDQLQIQKENALKQDVLQKELNEHKRIMADMLAEDESKKLNLIDMQINWQNHSNDLIVLQDKFTHETVETAKLHEQLNQTIEENRLMKERLDQLEMDHQKKTTEFESMTQMINENKEEIQMNLKTLQENLKSQSSSDHLNLDELHQKIEKEIMKHVTATSNMPQNVSDETSQSMNAMNQLLEMRLDNYEREENEKILAISNETQLLKTNMEDLISKVDKIESTVAINTKQLHENKKEMEQIAESHNKSLNTDFEDKLKEQNVQIASLELLIHQAKDGSTNHQEQVLHKTRVNKIVNHQNLNTTSPRSSTDNETTESSPSSFATKIELNDVKQSIKALQTLQVSNHNFVQRKLTTQKGEVDALEKRMKNINVSSHGEGSGVVVVSADTTQTQMVTLEEFKNVMETNKREIATIKKELNNKKPEIAPINTFNNRKPEIATNKTSMMEVCESNNLKIEDKWNVKFDSHTTNISLLFDQLKGEFESFKNDQQTSSIPEDMFKQLNDQIESLNIRVQQQTDDLAIAKCMISDGIINDKESEIHKSLMVETASNKDSVVEIRELIKVLQSQHDSSIAEIRTKLETDGCHVKTLLNAIETEILSFDSERKMNQSELDFIKNFVKESIANQIECNQGAETKIMEPSKIAPESSLLPNGMTYDIMLREWQAKFDVHQIKLFQLAEEGGRFRQHLGNLNKQIEGSSTFQEEVEMKLKFWYTWVESLEFKIQEQSNEIERIKCNDLMDMIETDNTNDFAQAAVAKQQRQQRRNENALEFNVSNIPRELLESKQHQIQDLIEMIKTELPNPDDFLKSDSSKAKSDSSKSKRRSTKNADGSNVDNLKRELKGKQHQLQATIGLVRRNNLVVDTGNNKVDLYIEQMERIESQLAEQARMLNDVLVEKEILEAQMAEKEEAISTVQESLQKSNEELQASKWENRGLHVTVTSLKEKEEAYKQKLDRLQAGSPYNNSTSNYNYNSMTENISKGEKMTYTRRRSPRGSPPADTRKVEMRNNAKKRQSEASFMPTIPIKPQPIYTYGQAPTTFESYRLALESLQKQKESRE